MCAIMYSFTMYRSKLDRWPFACQQWCRVKSNGHKIPTGFKHQVLANGNNPHSECLRTSRQSMKTMSLTMRRYTLVILNTWNIFIVMRWISTWPWVLHDLPVEISLLLNHQKNDVFSRGWQTSCVQWGATMIECAWRKSKKLEENRLD